MPGLEEVDIRKAVEKTTEFLLGPAQQKDITRAVWTAAQAGRPGPLKAFADGWPKDAGTMPADIDKAFVAALSEARKLREVAAATPPPATTTPKPDPAAEAAEKVKSINDLKEGGSKSIKDARRMSSKIKEEAHERGVNAAIKMAKESHSLVEAVEAAADGINKAASRAAIAMRNRRWKEVETELQNATEANDKLSNALDALDRLEYSVRNAIIEGDVTFLGRLKAQMKTREGWIQLGVFLAVGLLVVKILGFLGILLFVGLLVANLALSPQHATWASVAVGVLALTLFFTSGNDGGGQSSSSAGESTVVVNVQEKLPGDLTPMPTLAP